MIKQLLRRYALKRSTRFEIYKKLKTKYFQRYITEETCNGFCVWAFDLVNEALCFPKNPPGIPLDYLPELKAYKPKTNWRDSGYWYPVDTKGAHQRFLILQQIIDNE